MKTNREIEPMLLGVMFMAILIFLLVVALVAGDAHATDYCGQTITANTTLDQDQNCTGRLGIKLNSYVVLDMAGYTISGATNSCVRSAVNARNVSVKNGFVKNCGEEGVKFDGVFNGRVYNMTISDNTREGLWCKNCSQLIVSGSDLRRNSRGVRLEGGGTGGENRLTSVTAMENKGEGVLIHANSYNPNIRSCWLDLNQGFDLVFNASFNGVAVINGQLGHVRFFNHAYNNRVKRPYRSCDGDGTGSGSNSCS